MARFRVLRPVILRNMTGQDFQADPGFEFDSSGFLDFTASMALEPLDQAARSMIDVESRRILQEHAHSNPGSGEVPGQGPIQLLPTYNDPPPSQ